MVVLYVFFQYIFYDLYANSKDTFWVLYYWGIPVIFIITLLFYEILKPIGNWLRIYSFGLITVIFYHYLRLCYKYVPNKVSFMEKMEDSKPIYYTTIFYLAFSIFLYLFIIMLKKWTKKKKYN